MKAKRILVVEDDRVTQKVIVDALRSAGYEVVTAHNGAAAVKMAREQEPDLVTLDIHLAKDSPDDSWDGFSVAGRLRRMNVGKRMPVIVVISGLDPGKTIENTASVSAYEFLPKPFEKKRLLEVVAEALKEVPPASSALGPENRTEQTPPNPVIPGRCNLPCPLSKHSQRPKTRNG